MGSKYKKVVKARKKIQKKGISKPIILSCDFTLVQKKKEKILQGVNVLGYIEGTDENLKDELVILTAHYDHLGKRGDDIYNGADDNGSGTSTVLEVAEAFMEAKKKGVGPRRSVLTMLVTGEEKGLLGSKFYVEKPLFPLEKTIVDINVDMVGRVDKKHEDNPNYIYVIGSDRLSTELHEINESVNEKFTHLELDYTYNAKDDPNRYYYRSDHYNFAEKGIPAIFYFNGTHADYHRTSDTIEKINFEKMALIGQLVFYTAWEIANQDKTIEVDVFSED
jgi:Zn-dependent M28 family amino/carboxypeptidase